MEPNAKQVQGKVTKCGVITEPIGHPHDLVMCCVQGDGEQGVVHLDKQNQMLMELVGNMISFSSSILHLDTFLGK